MIYKPSQVVDLNVYLRYGFLATTEPPKDVITNH